MKEEKSELTEVMRETLIDYMKQQADKFKERSEVYFNNRNKRVVESDLSEVKELARTVKSFNLRKTLKKI